MSTDARGDALYSAESAMRQLAHELHGEAAALGAAADVLQGLRETERHKRDLADAKTRLAQWKVPLPW